MHDASFTATDALDLLDWKRQIFALYATVCATADPEEGWNTWRERRSWLFRHHPQSPIPIDQREGYGGPAYHPYDPRWRVLAAVEDIAPRERPLAASTSGTLPFVAVGRARFTLAGSEHELELAWNAAYGGGVLVVFADATSSVTTYGGGRYVVDTIKGADLGFDRERRTMVLDFNFAYNPSCAYDPRHTCPLAPAANRLPLAICAGERTAPAAGQTLD